MDFVHYDPAVSTFNEAAVWIDKSEPKPNVIVFDFIKAFLTSVSYTHLDVYKRQM